MPSILMLTAFSALNPAGGLTHHPGEQGERSRRACAIRTLHLRARACFQNMVGSCPACVTEYKMDIFHIEGRTIHKDPRANSSGRLVPC